MVLQVLVPPAPDDAEQGGAQHGGLNLWLVTGEIGNKGTEYRLPLEFLTLSKFTRSQMMNGKLRMLLVALPLLASAYQPAHATDGKTLPGAACQPLSKDALFSVSSTGVLFNTSTTAFLTVICPVVRDTIASDGISSAQVIAIDNNTASSVSCTLDSRSTSGLVSSRTANTVSGTNPSPQSLSYAALSSSSGGYYMFRCSIPPQQGSGSSGIAMYRVDEND